MNSLKLPVTFLGLGFALGAFSGCESTSMHSTPAGKNVQVEESPGDPVPQVSPVYLTPY